MSRSRNATRAGASHRRGAQLGYQPALDGLRDHFGNRVAGLAVGGSNQLGCGTLLPERYVDGQVVPNLPACAEWERRWTAEVAGDQPDVVMLMLGMGELYDRRVRGTVVVFGTPEYRNWLESEIEDRRQTVAQHTSRFVLATVPCLRLSADAADRNNQIANNPGSARVAQRGDPLICNGPPGDRPHRAA